MVDKHQVVREELLQQVAKESRMPQHVVVAVADDIAISLYRVEALNLLCDY